LAVVLYHYIYRYDKIYGHSFEVPDWIIYGKFGVHLFFMISGFVIYWTISRSKKPLDFVWSRLSRLYPVYWASLIITFTILTIFSLPGREQSFNTFLANFMMFHEYFSFNHIDGSYWSLTFELTFYFWILTIFCLGKIKDIEKILLFWTIGATFFAYYFYKFNVPPLAYSIFIITYINVFAAGICFFRYKENTSTIWTHLLILSSIISIYLGYPTKIFLLILIFFVIFSLIIKNKLKLLGNRLLVYLGSISYSLYLLHQNIGYVIINTFYAQNFNPILAICVSLGVSILLAHILLIVIERPSLNYLRDFYKYNNKMQLIGKKLMFLSNR
jgi:peptidoglycan/LPS O-acetylase OafA/YrhL